MKAEINKVKKQAALQTKRLVKKERAKVSKYLKDVTTRTANETKELINQKTELTKQHVLNAVKTEMEQFVT